MPYAPITLEDVAQNVRQLEKNDPVQDVGNMVTLLIQLRNAIGELQYQAVRGQLATSATIAMPNIDILKTLI